MVDGERVNRRQRQPRPVRADGSVRGRPHAALRVCSGSWPWRCCWWRPARRVGVRHRPRAAGRHLGRAGRSGAPGRWRCPWRAATWSDGGSPPAGALVTGVLAAAASAGQLVFLPLVATLARDHGWADPVPGHRGGGGGGRRAPGPAAVARAPPPDRGASHRSAGRCSRPAHVRPLGALGALRLAVRHRAFWFLAAGFAVCGASTKRARRDRTSSPPPTTTACRPRRASLLALVGLFDVAGTIASGWLTDGVDRAGCCWGTTRCAGCRCLLLRGCWPRTCSRRRGCSSCSTGWTGSPPSPRRSRWPVSTSGWPVGGVRVGVRLAPGGRRRHGPSPPAFCATAPAPTTARSGSAGCCACSRPCCRCGGGTAGRRPAPRPVSAATSGGSDWAARRRPRGSAR